MSAYHHSPAAPATPRPHEDEPVPVVPAWVAGDATLDDVIGQAVAEAGWRKAYDDLGNLHIRSRTARVWVGFLPEGRPEEPHRFQPADPGFDDDGIWIIRAYPYGDAAWTVWFNDDSPITSGLRVPPEMVAAVITELARPGREEPDWLADPGHDDEVWNHLAGHGWAVTHDPDDSRAAHSPDNTAHLHWHAADTDPDTNPYNRCPAVWWLRAGNLPDSARALWEARFSANTPAPVITAVMRVMTGPGLPRHPEDVPAALPR